MRATISSFLILGLLCLSYTTSQAQTYGQPATAQARPYPGGNILYHNPGQVYPPPGTFGGAAPAYPASTALPSQVMPPAPNASAQLLPSGYAQQPQAYNQGYAAGISTPVSSASMAAPAAAQINPNSGQFRPGVSLGAPNPHTNYVGDSEWKLFSQRTASFGPEVSHASMEVIPVRPSKTVPRVQSKSMPKPKSKPKPAVKPTTNAPKQPMTDAERDQFCLEYVEVCKDYFK